MTSADKDLPAIAETRGVEDAATVAEVGAARLTLTEAHRELAEVGPGAHLATVGLAAAAAAATGLVAPALPPAADPFFRALPIALFLGTALRRVGALPGSQLWKAAGGYAAGVLVLAGVAAAGAAPRPVGFLFYVFSFGWWIAAAGGRVLAREARDWAAAQADREPVTDAMLAIHRDTGPAIRILFLVLPVLMSSLTLGILAAELIAWWTGIPFDPRHPAWLGGRELIRFLEGAFRYLGAAYVVQVLGVLDIAETRAASARRLGARVGDPPAPAGEALTSLPPAGGPIPPRVGPRPAGPLARGL